MKRRVLSGWRVGVGVLACVGTATTGCSWHSSYWTPGDVETFVIPAEGIQRVQVRTQNGRITYRGREDAGGALHVTAQTFGGAPNMMSARVAARHIEVTHETICEVVQLGWQWRDRGFNWWAGRVHFTIEGPAEMDVTAASHNGGIEVLDVRGKADLQTLNGAIRAVSAGPELFADTRNGGIDATYSGPRLVLETSNGQINTNVTNCALSGRAISRNGAIDVRVGADTHATLEGSTGNGRIEVAGPLSIVRQKRQRLTATIGDGGEVFDVRTSNGSIRVRTE